MPHTARSNLFASPLLRRRVYWVLACLVAVAYCVKHVQAGFALPVPWPDESSFLWQAHAFAHAGTLFAPELNATRVVMWMPPAYMLAMGALFKIFGTSLAVARTASLLFMLAALALLAEGIRRYRFSAVALALLGAIALRTPLVVAGNVARMDAMLMLAAALSFFLFTRDRPSWGWCVAAISPLVHPNGVYLFIAASMIVAVRERGRYRAFVRREWIAMALAGALWTAYGVYVATHWESFFSDMHYQFARKEFNEFPMFRFWYEVVEALCAALIFYGWRKGRVKAIPLVFGAALWCMYGIGSDAWYECYGAVAVALLVGVIVPIVAPPLHPLLRFRRRAGAAAAVVIACALIAASSYSDAGEHVQHIPWTQHGWYGMTPEDRDVPYLSDGDRGAIGMFLDSLRAASRHVLVQFHPEADAMFFADKETDSLRFCQGTFYPFTPDLYIVHTSRYIPQWWAQDMEDQLKSMRLPRAAAYRVLAERNETEAITVYDYAAVKW